MKPNKKETTLLNDLISSEQLCVDKYKRYSMLANDKQLKSLFETIGEEENQHLDTLNGLLEGKVPELSSETNSEKTLSQQTFKSVYEANNGGEKKKNDAYLCTDTLSTEKHVSASYNTDIFEFVSTPVRDCLNHIQKEEQQHGKAIYDYMSANGMY